MHSEKHGKMKKRGLIIGGINPFHYGHLELLRTGLKHFEQIDFRVGFGKSRYVIPYEVRVNTLKEVIKENKLEGRVNILPKDKGILTLDTSVYDSLIRGSDILKHFDPAYQTNKTDKEFFSRFCSLFVLERDGSKIKPELKRFLQRNYNLTILPSELSISSKQIRESYRKGLNISYLMPKCVWEQIRFYADLFNHTDY